MASRTPVRKTTGSARTSRRLPKPVVRAIRDGNILGIKAGSQPHRFIGIWAVVVDDRVFVRSWSLKPRSWYRTFLTDPVGAINVEGREIKVRAVQTSSERLKKAVDRAYLEKYTSPGSIGYARDMGRARSRNTTTELIPAPPARRVRVGAPPRRPRLKGGQ
jgi:hypothetical protein